MKELTWKLIIPLTILSFPTFTLDWNIKTSEGFNYVLSGFPLPFHEDCLHTSLCSQVYILPFLANFLIIFFAWYLLIFAVNRLTNLTMNNWLTGLLLSLSGLTAILAVYWAIASPDDIYSLTRPIDFKVIDTSFRFF
ncbi:hypothetical protein BGP76_19220 [Reichenbachiella sp. MSK19-1]|nr:hypothetical protein BGP76_19220 [Reichenbachiella sp. MSK19-1]